MELVDVTVHYLEMLQPVQRDCPAPLSDLAVVLEPQPALEFYRSLYNAVGEDYRWLSRRKLADAELLAIIHDPLVETHLLQVAGATAGFAELDFRVACEIEIVQFGLLPQFIGQGLGQVVPEQDSGRLLEPWPQPRVAAHLHIRPSGGVAELSASGVSSVPDRNDTA